MKAGIMINRAELARMDARMQAQENRVLIYTLTGWLSAMYLIGKLLLWWHA